MKKNKGFTLIELLAIIVILAIIAVITVPIVLNIIENSKKGAATNSAYGYKDAVSKWYVQELSKPENQNLLLNGTYKVTNGNFENNEIPVTGDKPTNGILVYSNNTLTNGCLTIGDYKVAFRNGEVTSIEKGKCETILYYTYDSAAPANPIFYAKNSAKLPEPDASWDVYIKETTIEGIPSYGIKLTSGENKIQLGGIFDSEETCNAMIEEWTSNYASYLNGTSKQCKALANRTVYEVVGVKNFGTENEITFLLKANDLMNSINTLNTLFPGCNASPSYNFHVCKDSKILAEVYNAAHGTVGMRGSSAACTVSGFGVAECHS